ncbi:piggyBac transposable element-derived protein 4-like [Ostrea edulis]|uniref:piggyBac transposable element-derived protein 4-like n=1 Tax=Ostrea edulis TaxID=37623 RepID=UPI002095B837|nr:piggyBac transposable element-derived protein 4-like [Ostrea edulis]
MANVNWSDNEEVFQFPNDDSDNGSDFEGFNLAEIQLGNRKTLAQVHMVDFVPNNDRDSPIDLEEGWSREDVAPVNSPFVGEMKLNVDMDDFEPLTFLKLFVNDDFINLLVEQTNLYAQRRVEAGNVSQFRWIKQWRPVNMAEMKVFLSLTICMGLVQKNDVSDYLAADDVQDTPFFREQMSRDQFLLILSNFHLTDNGGQVGFDPLFKVRPVVNQLLTAFSEVYLPDRDLSFDEATCAWRGRLKILCLQPAKPAKFGIKLYQVCEVKSGYCIGFDIYTGSTPCTLSDAIGVNEDCTGTTRTVMGLLTRCGLLDK